MNLKTLFVAAVHGLNVFTSKLLESPEFKAMETAGTPIAEGVVTAALAPEIGPAAPLVASVAVTGAKDALDLVGAFATRQAATPAS